MSLIVPALSEMIIYSIKEKIAHCTFVALPFIAILGLLLLIIYRSNEYYNNRNVTKAYYEGYILQYPKINQKSQIIQLRDKKIITTNKTKYRIGDYIYVLINDNKSNSNSDSGVKKYIYFPKIYNDNSKTITTLNKVADLKECFISRTKIAIGDKSLSNLLLGITVGYRASFSNEEYAVLQKAGILHLLVASGYNINILIIFSYIYKAFGRKIYVLVTVFLVLIMSLLVGFEAPILRACIMGLLSIISVSYGIKKNTLYLLFLSLSFLIIAMPWLVLDLSMQFSFIAVAGVYMTNSLVSNTNNKLIKMVLASIVVNVMLLPIQSYYFGVVNIFSIVGTTILSLFIPFTMILGVLVSIIPYFTALNMFLYYYLLLVQHIIQISSDLNVFIINHRMSFSAVLLSYLLFAFIYMFILKIIRPKHIELEIVM